jgi:hypothetical protein
MQQSFFSAGLILAWLVTPESLRLVDVATGMSGLLIIVSLGCGFTLSLASGTLIHSPKLDSAGYNSEYKALSHVYGKAVGLAALLSGRIPLLLFTSTGMLVTAGFAFNEIFLYWFPNFLFAFILLLLVAILNISDKRFVYWSQSVFVLLTISGLLALIILGITSESTVTANYVGQQKGLSATLLAMGCISFLVFDLHASKQGRGIVVFSLLGGFVLLVLWAVTALKFSTPDLLAESTIAHMQVARAIAGESGRLIMGSVVIFGVLSGVNGLFILVRKVFADLQEEGVIPQRINTNWLVTILLSATVGLMMITGFAGEQILEARIKASIILWLIFLSLRSFSAGLLLKNEGRALELLGYLTSSAYFFAGAVLVTTSARMEYIFWFIVAVFTGTVVLSLIWTWTTAYINKGSQNPISRRM